MSEQSSMDATLAEIEERSKLEEAKRARNEAMLRNVPYVLDESEYFAAVEDAEVIIVIDMADISGVLYCISAKLWLLTVSSYDVEADERSVQRHMAINDEQAAAIAYLAIKDQDEATSPMASALYNIAEPVMDNLCDGGNLPMYRCIP